MLLDWTDKLARTDTAPVVLGMLVLSVFLVNVLSGGSWAKLPIVNEKKLSEVLYTNSKKRFQSDAYNLIKAGFEKSRNAFRIVTDNGPRMVLSARYANDLRNDERLSFGKFMYTEFHGHIPGFEVFQESNGPNNTIFLDAVRMKLTQALGHITEPLSKEATNALQKNWTDNSDWHELVLKPSILDIVAQLSSKVFLGDEICRNPAWLRITVDYTVNAFMAAAIVRVWPKPLRRIAAWFLPSCKKLRAQSQEARDIITPILENKRARKAALLNEGKTPERSTDAIEWLDECAKGRVYDPAITQLLFSMAAIHTTSDMITQVIFDLCEQPDLVQALREEVISVISAEGWKKTSLYKLKLMDSVLKESQRIKPISIVSMRRVAEQNIQLHDGTQIPRGTSIMVSQDQLWDTSMYPNSETFDGYRFLKMRQIPGYESSAQLVATSPQHMGFGHGKHACPGRFFAANELKIALCHMLLKYDFKLADDCPPVVRMGLSMSTNPKGRIALRRRQEEIPL